MNTLLWILQILAGTMFGASGIMKVFMFDKISQDVPSFGALPKRAWTALGILELACAPALIVPGAFHLVPMLTPLAASVLAAECLIFIRVHVKYKEIGSIVISAVLGLIMAFIACGRAGV